ncbi:extensin-like isoform X34 [Alosa sapidissima]|uniref:extensin-like isoform X34 n=1 Tax=Alosa sapidissima TaxID=34773 RepID=UPI001C094918|nr:extensin-like isoform X34 [Alosa sapidissima]
MSLGLMFRLLWICLFFLTDVGLCSPRLQGLEVPQSFGYFGSRPRPPGGAPVSSVSDHSFTNGEDASSSTNEPVQENLSSHQEKMIPVWTFSAAQEAPAWIKRPPAPVNKKPKMPEAPAQEPPAWVQTPPAWNKMPPAPVNEVPEAPAQEPPAWVQMPPEWNKMPPAPVNEVPEDPAQEPPAWVQMPPEWNKMPPVPVNEVPEAPSQEPPAWVQTPPAWDMMPPAPVNKKPKVPEAPAQEPPAWVQTPPAWNKMPPAPVNKKPKVPSVPVASVSDHSLTNGKDASRSNEPVQVNLNSHQEKLIPVWTLSAAQKFKTPGAPSQEPPAWVQTPPAWNKMPPAPVNKKPKVPEAPAQEPPAWVQTPPAWNKMPPAPVNKKPKVPEAPAQEPPAWVQMPPEWNKMPPAPVNEVPEAPAQEPPAWVQTPPAWNKMPPAPVNEVPEAPAQEPPAWVQTPPVWNKMPPAPVNKKPKVPSVPVASVSDHSLTNGEDASRPNEPVQVNLNSHQEKLIPVWTFSEPQGAQKFKTPEAPAQEPPAWVQTPPAWNKMPPAPVNKKPKVPSVPVASVSDHSLTNGEDASRPNEPVQVNLNSHQEQFFPVWTFSAAQKFKTPGAPAQEPPAWVQTPPAWNKMPPAPVNKKPKVPSVPVASVSDHSLTNGKDASRPNEPVQVNLNSHQEQFFPVWTFSAAQKFKTPGAPAQEPPAWVQTPPAWNKMPPAPVNKKPKVPEAPAQEPPAWVQMPLEWNKMPPAPVNEVPEAPAQGPPAWVQMPLAWIKMPPAPVNKKPKVSEAPAQQPPAWVQTPPAWNKMPPAPVNKKPKVPSVPVASVSDRSFTNGEDASRPNEPVQVNLNSHQEKLIPVWTLSAAQKFKTPGAPAQEPPAWAQMPPTWIKMPPAPVNEKPKVPEAPAQEPPASGQKPPALNHMPQAPAQTPPPQMTSLDRVGGSFGSSFMEDVGGEATSNGGATEGSSSGPEHYLVITEPLGFQTRYVVKSFNRYVRGKKIYTQTTYIPLDDPPASEPALVPSPPHEAPVDQTVKPTPKRIGLSS